MADANWNLEELDPAMLERLTAEAEERGVSPADYITNALLSHMIAETGVVSAEPAASHPKPREDSAFRQRLEALERRVTHSFAGIEEAIGAVNGACIDIATQFDEAEAHANTTHESVLGAMAELRATVDALEQRAGDTAAAMETLQHAQDVMRVQTFDNDAVLEHRIALLEDGAAYADRAASELAASQEALKHAVATDFLSHVEETHQLLMRHEAETNTNVQAFARQTAADVTEVAARAEAIVADAVARAEAAAKDASRHADEAAAHAIRQITEARQIIEQQAHTRAVETHAEIRSNSERASAQSEALTLRLDAHERTIEQIAEDLRGEISAHDKSAKVALSELAVSLHQSHTDLLTEHTRLHADLTSAARESHASLLAETTRVQSELTGALHDSQASLRAETTRVQTEFTGALYHSHASLLAETARVQAELTGSLHESHSTLLADAARLQAELSGQIGDVRDRQLGAAARLRLIESEFDKLSTDVVALRGDVDARLLDAAAIVDEKLGAHLAAEGARSGGLGSRLDMLERIAEHKHVIVTGEIERVEACTLAALKSAADERQALAASLKHEIEQCVGIAAAATTQTRAQLETNIADLQTQQRGSLARLKLVDETLAAHVHTMGEANAMATVLARRIDQTDADAAIRDATIREALAKLEARLEGFGTHMDTSEDVAASGDLKARLAVQEHDSAETASRVSELARLMSYISTQNADAARNADERLHKMELALADLRLETLAVKEAHASRADSADTTETAEQNEASLAAIRQTVEERILGVEARCLDALDQVNDTLLLLSKKPQHSGEGEADTDIARSA